MKKFFYLIFLYMPWLAHPQQDTARLLREIIIEDKSTLAKWMIVSKDTIFPESIDEMIEKNTPVVTKTYSPGGIVSLSYHGFGAGHTLLLWNGFPINSPYLGQPLLHGLFSSNNTNISFWPGSISSSIFPGGLAATISLDEKISTNSSISLSYASFKTFSGFADFPIKLMKNTSISPKLIYQQSKNDFTFINNAFGSKEHWYLDRRVNADYKHLNALLPFLWEKPSWRVFSSLWFKQSNMGLPSALLAPQLPDNERWYDHALLFITKTSHKLSPKLQIEGAFFLENTQARYTNHATLLHSDTRTFRHAFNLDLELVSSATSYGDISIYAEQTYLQGNNYAQHVNENYYFLKSSYNLLLQSWGKLLFWNTFTRDFPYIVPGMMFTTNPFSKNLTFMFGISRNTRRPTINDKYWHPGGNPNLNNEITWTSDVAGLYIFNNKKLEGNFELRGFYYEARNWIIWLPDSSSSLWTPQNIMFVRGYGSDQKIHLQHHLSHFTLSVLLVSTYQHIKNKDVELMYVPQWKTSGTVKLSFKKIMEISWQTVYTGKRFTNVDNTRYLPYYIVHDLTLRFYPQHHHTFFPTMTFECNNLFNANYQEIAWYPMPRRNVKLILSWIW